MLPDCADELNRLVTRQGFQWNLRLRRTIRSIMTWTAVAQGDLVKANELMKQAIEEQETSPNGTPSFVHSDFKANANTYLS